MAFFIFLSGSTRALIVATGWGLLHNEGALLLTDTASGERGVKRLDDHVGRR
jgi:hypothetical protein